jgi:hypothetical protein
MTRATCGAISDDEAAFASLPDTAGLRLNICDSLNRLFTIIKTTGDRISLIVRTTLECGATALYLF